MATVRGVVTVRGSWSLVGDLAQTSHIPASNYSKLQGLPSIAHRLFQSLTLFPKSLRLPQCRLREVPGPVRGAERP